MEIRQIVTVALFMFAAAIMKNAMPGQLFTSESVDTLVVGESSAGENPARPEILAAVPKELLDQANGLISKQKPELSESPKPATETVPVPGSLIALVVAALGLVSVARRPVV